MFYDGYWIRYYAPPEDSLANRKRLIGDLARRVFHHTEAGINTPGDRVDEARAAFESHTDPALKRVAGAMLAGALFNRASDIFGSIVDLGEKGVEIGPDDAVMQQCGAYFREALELGIRYVRHRSGADGIDELWGEPFKAFNVPVGEFHRSRYLKIAQTMRDIDRVARALEGVLRGEALFAGVGALIQNYAEAAKLSSETMKSDADIFQVWPRFVASGEALLAYRVHLPVRCTETRRLQVEHGMALLRSGKELIQNLANARVPLPQGMAELLRQCNSYRGQLRVRRARRPARQAR